MCYTLQFSILCLVLHRRHIFSYFFFFNDTATTEIYTLSLHDALPISDLPAGKYQVKVARPGFQAFSQTVAIEESRSEEHTSELQSRLHLVCRLLLEKKKFAIFGEVASTMDAISEAALFKSGGRPCQIT